MTRATAINGLYRNMREIWHYEDAATEAAHLQNIERLRKAEARAVRYATALVREHGFNIGTIPMTRIMHQVKNRLYDFSH